MVAANQIDDICRLYKSGQTLTQIAELHDIKVSAVRDALVTAGISKRDGGAALRARLKKADALQALNTRREAQAKERKEKHQPIIDLFRQGKTLAEIGDLYGVTRERIRQILKKNGVDSDQGGQSIRTKISREERAQQQDAYWFKKYGLDRSKVKECQKARLTHAYFSQARNAATRGVDFRIAFNEWLQVWQDSGHINQRGRGHGKYVMSRYGDKGAYEVGNVFIQLADENNREYALRRYGKLTSTPAQPEAA